MSFYTVLRGMCFVLLALAGAVGAQAQTSRAISGSSGQLFIGQVVPIPDRDPSSFSGAAPFPDGGAVATPYAYAVTWNAGATVAIASRGISHGGPGSPQSGVNRPLLFFGQGTFFQVYTDLSVQIPRVSPTPAPQSGLMSDSAFFASGRTGADVVSWCPGLTATVLSGVNPGCSAPTQAPVITLPACTGLGQCPHSTQTLMTRIAGSVRYNRTAGQLGGAARVNLGGLFDVALNLYSAYLSAPATVFFVGGTPNPTPAIGGEFGVLDQRAVPSLQGIVVSHFTTNGRLTGTLLATGITPPVNLGADHTLASFGVPFTAGQLVLSVTANLGPDDVFTLTGSDNRSASGAGNVSLVGGAVSLRSTTGLNANRGILSLTLPEPPALLGAAAALGVLAGCHRWTRRRRSRGHARKPR